MSNRHEDRKYLDHVKTMHCSVTHDLGNEYLAIDPAHIGRGGISLKEHDFHVLPLKHSLHQESHEKGEFSSWSKWFARYPIAIKEALQAWGTVLYLKYLLDATDNLDLVEKINEMKDENKNS